MTKDEMTERLRKCHLIAQFAVPDNKMMGLPSDMHERLIHRELVQAFAREIAEKVKPTIEDLSDVPGNPYRNSNNKVLRSELFVFTKEEFQMLIKLKQGEFYEEFARLITPSEN